MRVHLKGVHSVTVGAKTYHYAWRGGPRLSGEPGSPEFVAGYEQAHRGRKTPPADSMLALVASYRTSGEFDGKADRTKADYLKHMKAIEGRFGDFPTAGLADRRARGIFKKWRDELAQRSKRQADYAWVVLNIVLNYAVDNGDLDRNPLLRAGRLYRADRTERIWTDDDEAAYLAAAPPHLRLPILLALWTGLRQGDLLALTWGQYDGRYIRVRQSKTRRRVTIPVGAPLKAALDAARRRAALVLLNSDGKPWTADGFRSSWRKAVKRAGITGLTFHDLRGSAVTRLALAGCPVPEIATITGHALGDVEAILDAHYLSRDVALAESAIARLEKRTEAVKSGVKRPAGSDGESSVSA